MSVNLKDRKVLVVAGISSVIVIILLIAFLPSGKDDGSAEPEVISKRARITMAENIDASATPEGSAAALQPAAAMPASAEAPKAEVKTSVAEAPRAEVRKAEPAAAEEAKRPRPEPKAAEKPAPRKEPVKAEAVKKAEPKAKPGNAVAKVSEQILGSKPWALNVASFPSLNEAQSLAGALKKAGHHSYITEFTKDSVKWHRVRVGFYATREEAQKAGGSIKGKFNIGTPWVVKPDKNEMRAHY